MYCRNCGKETAEGAEGCFNCGMNPLSKGLFCQRCGKPTDPEQVLCVNCGAGLARVAAGAKGPDRVGQGLSVLAGAWGWTRTQGWARVRALVSSRGAAALVFALVGLAALAMLVRPLFYRSRMILVPAGEFQRTGPKDVTFTVHVDAFYLDKYPVTFAQYDRFCDAADLPKPFDNGWGRGKQPVINVSWEDAREYAHWQGKRLPTEAEYEWASRAGATTKYWFGDVADNLGDYAWFKANASGRAHPVGLKEPNPLGFYDLAGDVFEWCSDWAQVYNVQDRDNPKGPASGVMRAQRGGFWDSPAEQCRVDMRFMAKPGDRTSAVGFRCAQSAAGGAEAAPETPTATATPFLTPTPTFTPVPPEATAEPTVAPAKHKAAAPKVSAAVAKKAAHWLALGDQLSGQSQYPDAILAYKKVLEYEAGNKAACRGLAACYMATGDLVQALKYKKLGAR